MFTDNQKAIQKIDTEGIMSSSKHVDVRLKVVCEIEKRDIVRSEYIESRIMMADIYTKALLVPRMAKLMELFSLR